MNKDKNNNEPRTLIDSGYEIEIKTDSQLDVLEGTSKKTGKPYKLVKQEAWLHQGYGYPVRCFISLASEEDKYDDGAYFMGDLLDIGGWGDLQISRKLKLVPKV